MKPETVMFGLWWVALFVPFLAGVGLTRKLCQREVEDARAEAAEAARLLDDVCASRSPLPPAVYRRICAFRDRMAGVES